MTVAMLIGTCNNIRISTRAFITDTRARILHNSNTLTIKPEIMCREVSGFVIDGDTIFIIVY